MKRKALAAKVIETVHDELLEGTALDFPPPLIREVIDREPELDREVRLSKGGLDTDVRELFLETVSQMLIGEPWPLNGDAPDRAKATLKRFKEAAEKKGVKFPAPKVVTKLEFDIKIRKDGIRLMTMRGAIDESNYTGISYQFVTALGKIKPKPGEPFFNHRIALDFGTAKWTNVDHALYALESMAGTVHEYEGRMAVFGVAPEILKRMEELRSKTAPSEIPEVAGSAAEAIRLLTGPSTAKGD